MSTTPVYPYPDDPRRPRRVQRPAKASQKPKPPEGAEGASASEKPRSGPLDPYDQWADAAMANAAPAFIEACDLVNDALVAAGVICKARFGAAGVPPALHWEIAKRILDDYHRHDALALLEAGAGGPEAMGDGDAEGEAGAYQPLHGIGGLPGMGDEL